MSKKRGILEINIRRDGRKAQLSAFILMGLVIMTIFFFMYYIRGQIIKQKVEEKIDIAAEILQNTPVLNYYVTTCLQDVVEDAIILVGKQGGNIYADQDGLIDRNSVPIFKYMDDNITYGMTSIDSNVPNAQRLVDDPTYPMPFEYPCIKTTPPLSYLCPYDFLIPEDRPVNFFPFSKRYLPLLCILNGPNDVAVGIYPFPCPSGSYGPNSIQQQIKHYTEIKIQNCTNFSAIKQMISFNITAEAPQVWPIIGENDIVVRAVYPINITVEKYGGMRLFEFETKMPVRLKKVYSLAQYLIENDKGYLDFNITRDFKSDEFWDPYMRIEKFCPKCLLEGGDKDTTDIVQINDSGSNILGSDYYFRFAVENRIPALDYIHKTSSDETQFDYIMQEGDEIVIEPKGYDPDDDDDLYYAYEGWKQTYDEVFDPSCCNEINDDSPVICKDEPWKCVVRAGDAIYQMCTNGGSMCMDNCLQNEVGIWQNSILYNTASPNDASDIYRRANYITKTTDPGKIISNPNLEDTNPVHYPCIKDADGNWQGAAYSRDLGPHNVTVEACDGHGKCDWQSVLIMVTDIPRPVIEVINDYGTQDASIEDPYTLDASKSNIFSVVDSYTWKDFPVGVGIPDFDFTVQYSQTQNGRIRIPFPSYDIETINSPDSASKFFRNIGTHTLSLTIGSQTASKEITVKQCIPYAGSYSPYPYNPEGTDPFMANHVCCQSDGTYSPKSTICYNYVGEYVSLFDYENSADKFKGDNINHLTQWYLNGGFTTEKPSKTSEYANDIFFRDFERHCSNDRGNICSGTGQEEIYISKTCNDFDASIRQDERCQGPPKGTFESASGLNCINYPIGTTFESDYGGPALGGPADGRCSNMDKCTNAVDFRQDGKFWCVDASCDGNGYCSKPYATSQCYCSVSCGASSQCTSFNYNSLGPGQCTANGFCTSGCQFKGPDESQAACECADDVWAAGTPGDTEINVNGNVLCCGNSPLEIYTKNPFNVLDDACCDGKDDSGNPLLGTECVYGGVCKETRVEPERCDNIDNDCDGIKDNNILGAPKCGSFGVCKDVQKICISGAWVECSQIDIPDYEPNREVSCDDDKDNDCDGWTDDKDSDC